MVRAAAHFATTDALAAAVAAGGGSSGVASFNGRAGAVVPATSDYTFAQLAAKPTTLAGYGVTDGVTTSDSRLSDARTPTAHTQAASTIADSTAAGRALLTAADAAAQRAALALGAAASLLAITTTNLPGSLQWSLANAIAAGAMDRPVSMVFDSPMKAVAAATATTIVLPAAGAGVQFRVNVGFYVDV